MATDLQKFLDKKVKLIRNLDKPNEKGESAEELEGTVMAVTGAAIMFRPKGKTGATIIENSVIESIDYAETGDKKLARKTLKVVQFGQARAHLLERHAATLTAVNGMTEKEAFETHEAIDHENLDLGHVHADKAAEEAAPEVADNEDD